MLAGEGLHPSSKGKRIQLSQGQATVTDSLLTEAKELIVGFWFRQVKSLDEAVEWIKRMPSPSGVADGEIEIRQVFEDMERPKPWR
jgi:hypothetical protein